MPGLIPSNTDIGEVDECLSNCHPLVEDKASAKGKAHQREVTFETSSYTKDRCWENAMTYKVVEHEFCER